MGFSPQRSSSRGSRSTPTTLAEINVTPLVDVMLVLLIIFMISAPMMQQGVHVDLPKANAGSLDDVPDQLVLTINSNQQISINNTPIDREGLRIKLEGMVSVKPQLQVFIQADQKIPYGAVAQLIAEVKKAKITRVGLVTAPET